MEVFKIKFNMPYIETDVFKQKHYAIILTTINNSRLSEQMHFDGPGLITFDENDKQHNNPIITLSDKYNRLKTNCLVYSLPETPNNMGYYDKLFIYYTTGVKIPYYGYVLYNTKTDKTEHVYFIDDDYNDLLRCLNQTFNRLYDETLYEHYGKKVDAITGHNGMTMDDCPSIKDYDAIIEERDNRIINFIKTHN